MQRNEAATVSALPDTSLTYFYIVNGRAISSPTEIRIALLESALWAGTMLPFTFFALFSPSTPTPLRPSAATPIFRFAAQMWRDLQPKLQSG